MDRSQPFPMERLSEIDIFDVGDVVSRRAAVEANKLVEQWTNDFRRRVGFWQTVIKVVVHRQGNARMFTDNLVEWMAEHVKRKHSQWLQDKATINVGSKEFEVPEDARAVYLERMKVRAK